MGLLEVVQKNNNDAGFFVFKSRHSDGLLTLLFVK